MKKLLIALFVLSIVSPVLAEEPPAEPPPIVEASHNAVVAFLKLTPEQVEDWDAMYQLHRELEQPLKEDIKTVQEELDRLFEEDPLDPVAIGNKVIERRELGDRLIEVHVTYHEDFLLLLDDTQTRKLRIIARADDVQKFIPAFKLFELIPRR
jgi:Spy/CpxP family protein refolding chaperone